ncbi:MAG: cob(I)yrinic acid a,c-diamide adenosyltransferase [Bacteroidetes bacterium]|nr:cob(I)yrinic acid a,c-diamide adenosyltransferase [Bacteroidota bacterium]MBU1113609.1 cob(I)yrinic acid a,c-diamide adenosyltransferase [Bacteroidota bacterium]MBU1800319.1 cob(I)yrinic acid a,c-diamide adenosyltransferase [Bacteroidota bacterium]
MKIYTKTGDDGSTGLFGGERVSKNSLRVECYGTVDELNSTLGMANSVLGDYTVNQLMHVIQNKLFTIGGELATPNDKSEMNKVKLVNDDILLLEKNIDIFEEKLEPLKQFILPGGTNGASLLHFARSVCRRAERLVTSLSQVEKISNLILIYLNRLSDLLFVLARYENSLNHVDDIPWQK